MRILRLLLLVSSALAMLGDMAPMNPYSTSCTGFLSAMYAFGGQKCLALKSWNRGPCMCGMPEYVATVVSCIDAQMKNVTAAERNSTRTMAYEMFLKMDCPDANITMTDLNAYQRNVTNLPLYDQSLWNGKVPWPATGAFRVTDTEAYNALQARVLYDTAEPRAKRFGAALNGYWAGIVLLRVLSLWFVSVFPTVRNACSGLAVVRWLRRYVTMPGLFGRGSQTLARYGIFVPTRAHSLAVFGYVVLVVVFTFADLPIWYPNYTWAYDDMETYGSYVGQRSGVLIMYMCPELFLFAGRNNFLQLFTGWTQEVFVLYHRWVGRCIAFELIVHIIGYTVERAAAGRFGEMWSEAYWNWGIVGATFGLLLAAHSLLFLRRYSYEIFLAIHIVSICLFIVGTYFHLDLLDEPIGLYFIWAMIAVWALDRAMRLLRVVTSNPLDHARVTLHENALEIIMARPKSWRLQMRPGTHVFVHIVHPLLILQSHPFTLMSSVDEPNKIKLICGVRSGMTRRLARMALAAPDLSFTTRVLLDGPYGQSYDLSEFDECVFVAGGVGITAPFAYIQNILWKYPRGFQKITLLWAMRDEVPQKWFESELQLLSEYSRVEVQLYIGSGSSKHARRLDITGELHARMAASSGPMSVLCCGPATMNSEAREAVLTGLNLTKNYVEYFDDSFSY